jgi:3'-phosphoadenosine 5'-phosphosulfate sulfotransferase
VYTHTHTYTHREREIDAIKNNKNKYLKSHVYAQSWLKSFHGIMIIETVKIRNCHIQEILQSENTSKSTVRRKRNEEEER